jgi:hypothetical protein
MGNEKMHRSITLRRVGFELTSLYGRFGINPQCTMTEICNDDRLFHLKRLPGFINYRYLDKDAIAGYPIFRYG